jgi:hypothetical protein
MGEFGFDLIWGVEGWMLLRFGIKQGARKGKDPQLRRVAVAVAQPAGPPPGRIGSVSVATPTVITLSDCIAL